MTPPPLCPAPLSPGAPMSGVLPSSAMAEPKAPAGVGFGELSGVEERARGGVEEVRGPRSGLPTDARSRCPHDERVAAERERRTEERACGRGRGRKAAQESSAAEVEGIDRARARGGRRKRLSRSHVERVVAVEQERQAEMQPGLRAGRLEDALECEGRPVEAVDLAGPRRD